jgi:hypothetical protein
MVDHACIYTQAAFQSLGIVASRCSGRRTGAFDLARIDARHRSGSKRLHGDLPLVQLLLRRAAMHCTECDQWHRPAFILRVGVSTLVYWKPTHACPLKSITTSDAHCANQTQTRVYDL